MLANESNHIFRSILGFLLVATIPGIPILWQWVAVNIEFAQPAVTAIGTISVGLAEFYILLSRLPWASTC